MPYPPASLIATGIIFALLCVVLTSLRVWVRWSYSRVVSIDDKLIIIAALIVTSFDALQVENIIHGQATNKNRDAASYVLSTKIIYYQKIAEKIAYGCIKLSFLAYYRRIFSLWPSFRKVNNVLVAVIVMWMMAYLVSAIFICGVHPAAQWEDPYDRLEKCYDDGAMLFSFAITNVITDLAVLSLPFAYVHRLRLRRSERWAVAGVFFLGFLSTTAGIVRMAIVSVYVKLHQFDYIPPPVEHMPKILNVVGPLGPIFWVNLELVCGVVAANLPPMWPFIRNPLGFKELCARVHREVTASTATFDSSTSQVRGEPMEVFSTLQSVVIMGKWRDDNGTTRRESLISNVEVPDSVP